MNRLTAIAAGAILVAGVAGVAISSAFLGNAEEVAPDAEIEATQPAAPAASVEMAQATTEADDAKETTEEADASETPSEDTEDKPMSEVTTRTPEEQEAFKQTMHEGDVALGVCGARVSALLWFYEASVAQGRDDLKPAVESLTESREAIKAEAERRAVDDKVDTSVRVMNAESEKLWEDLNEKAGGETEAFQKAHDELLGGVQECLNLFFDRPKEEGAKAE